MSALLSDRIPFDSRVAAPDKKAVKSAPRMPVLVIVWRLLSVLAGKAGPHQTAILTLGGFAFVVAGAFQFGKGWGFLAAGLALLLLEWQLSSWSEK